MEFMYGTGTVFLRSYHLVLPLLIYKYALEKKNSNRRNLPQYCEEKYHAVSTECSILLTQLSYVCFPLRETGKRCASNYLATGFHKSVCVARTLNAFCG